MLCKEDRQSGLAVHGNDFLEMCADNQQNVAVRLAVKQKMHTKAQILLLGISPAIHEIPRLDHCRSFPSLKITIDTFRQIQISTINFILQFTDIFLNMHLSLFYIFKRKKWGRRKSTNL